MELAWFIFTLALMMLSMTACAANSMLWLIAGRKDCRASSAGFAAYFFSVALIFFDEYVQVKPSVTSYITTTGLLHPWLEVPLGVFLAGACFSWLCCRLGIKTDEKGFWAPLVAFAVIEVLLCPVAGNTTRLRTFSYWLVHDIALIGMIIYGFWYAKFRASDAVRLTMRPNRLFYALVLIMALAVLAEDTYNILVSTPDLRNPLVREFYWHLTERNLAESVLATVLAIRSMSYVRNVMRVYSHHPAEDDAVWEDGGAAVDFDARVLRFCDDVGMSAREREVFRLVMRGKDTQGIASELYISPGTVKAHLHRIYTKAGVTGRQELISTFWKH